MSWEVVFDLILAAAAVITLAQLAAKYRLA
jgi:hypothetical protein